MFGCKSCPYAGKRSIQFNAVYPGYMPVHNIHRASEGLLDMMYSSSSVPRQVQRLPAFQFPWGMDSDNVPRYVQTQKILDEMYGLANVTAPVPRIYALPHPGQNLYVVDPVIARLPVQPDLRY